MGIGRGLRGVRAGVFASVCAGVSAVGHTVASGHAPGWAGPVVGFAMLFGCAWGVASKERGLGTICAWMLWGQLALHLLFGFTQSPAAHSTAEHGAWSAAVDTSTGTGPGMLAAHVAAALVSGWWLRRGEAALFRLLESLGSALLPVLVVLVPAAVRPTGEAAARPRTASERPRPRFLRYSLVLRGPPEGIAARSC